MERSNLSPEMTFPMAALSPCGKQLVIDHLTEAEITETFRMVAKAAEKGEGFGEDEYLCENHFRAEIDRAQKFGLKDAKTGELFGGLFLLPSALSRTQRNRDVLFIIKDSQRQNGLAELFACFGIDYSIISGYDSLYADAFADNIVCAKMAKAHGYQKVGHLPLSGWKNHGHVSSDIYFLDLRKKRKFSKYCFAQDGVYTPLSKIKSKL